MGKFLFLFVLFVIHFIYAGAQDSIVGYWSFDSFSDETFKDDSKYLNYGSTFDVSKTDGILGNALLFNGENSYASIIGTKGEPPAIISSLDEGTISLWFKVETIPTEFGIAPIFYFGTADKCDHSDAANQGLIIEIGHSPIFLDNESIFYTVWKNGCTNPSLCFDSGFRITKGVWHHYAVVINEDSNTAYFNGEEMVDRKYNFGKASYSQFFNDAVAKEVLWLGKGHWDRTEQFFDGAIDELKIFNKALSASEITKLYQEVEVATSVDLKRYDSDINVYPNPASGHLNIENINSGFEVDYLIITDLEGNQLKRMTGVEKNQLINLSEFSNGLYFITLYGDQLVVHKKIVVAK